MFHGFALSRTTMSRSLIGSYLTSAPVTFLWIQTATPDMPRVGRPEYTTVWPYSVVKCPCPSHITSYNPHISTPNLIISSLSSWAFPSCSILRIFHVPSLRLLCSCSCLSPCDNIVVFFIMVGPVTASTLPWLFNRGPGTWTLFIRATSKLECFYLCLHRQ